MTSIGLFLSALCVLTLGGIASAFHRKPGRGVALWGAGITAVGAILSLPPAIGVLRTGKAAVFSHPWSVPFGTFSVAVDPLSALFIILISVGCLLSAVYGMGYLEDSPNDRHPGSPWCFFNLLFASMLLVTSARNGVLFIMAWEAMSLTSFFLVMFDHEKASVREAGWTYLTAAHLGAACLLVLFLLMGGGGGNLDFDRMTAPAGPAMAGGMFILAVLGFGAKAGFMPLHVWLPEAHPAAPSHVSAVMSGVMIKTGIYGLVRIVSMLGAPALWWGWTLLVIGAVSGILGILSAIPQHNLKRLLAYSSVENIGIICIGLGLWLLGTAAGHAELAAFGLIGSLLHVLNHSLFKTLLFLGAGAVKHGTRTLNMNRLGGLGKRMPKTGLAFLFGAAAICGLPPFNGFVGELFIYLGSFGAVSHVRETGILGAGGLTALLSLGLIGALAVVCFTLVYGMVFSGEPRSPEAAHAHEPSARMWVPMTLLAALCLILGLAAPLGVTVVAPAARELLGKPLAHAVLAMAYPLLVKISLIGVIGVIISLLLVVLRSRLQSARRVEKAPTWDCGYIAPDSRMQYTASSYALPVVDMFGSLARPRLKFFMGGGDFPEGASLSSRAGDLFRTYLFSPLFRCIETVARALHGLQQGRNQLYVLYIAIAVLALLLLKVR